METDTTIRHVKLSLHAPTRGKGVGLRLRRIESRVRVPKPGEGAPAHETVASGDRPPDYVLGFDVRSAMVTLLNRGTRGRATGAAAGPQETEQARP